MRFSSTIPTRCIEAHPTTQTIVFCGVPVNLSVLSRSFDPPLDRSYLTKLFRGHRDVTTINVQLARDIATGLGMDLPTLIDALERPEVHVSVYSGPRSTNAELRAADPYI